MADAQKALILQSIGLKEEEAKQIITTSGVATAQTAAAGSSTMLTTATHGLKAAFVGLGKAIASNPFLWIIGGISILSSAYNWWSQKLEKAKQDRLESGNAAREEAKETLGLLDAYNKAKAAYDSNTGSKEDLNAATSNLAASLGLEQSALDDLIAKYGTLDAAIRVATNSKLRADLSKMTAGYDTTKENLLDAAGGVESWLYDGIVIQKTKENQKYLDQLYKSGFTPRNGKVYTQAFDVGNANSVDDVIEMYNTLSSMQSALEKGIGEGLYSREELSGSDAYKKISDGIAQFATEYKDVMDYVDDMNTIASQIQFNDYVGKNGLPKTKSEFDSMLESMKSAAGDGAVATGDFVGTQEQASNAITEFLSKVPGLSQFFTDYTEGTENAAVATAESIDKVREKAKTFASGLSEIQGIVSAQANGKSLSVDDLNATAIKDYFSAIEYSNGTMQLNAEKAKEIAKAKAEEQVAINNTNKSLEQSKYLENAKQIEKYRDQLAKSEFAEGENAQKIQANIDLLTSQNSTIADTCKQYDVLSSSIMAAVGAYQNWLNAQNASDYGDMANDAVGAITKILDTYDEESAIFGDFGSKKFDAAVEFIVPESVDPENQEAIQNYMNDFQKYLSFNEDGGITGLNTDQFLIDAVNKQLMKYTEDDGFQILGNKKMEDFAEGLNMSSGMVQSFFDELQLKGGEFDWGDEVVRSFGDLFVLGTESANKLRESFGEEIISVSDDVGVLNRTVRQMNDFKAKPDIDVSDVDLANNVIQSCVAQRQILEEPAIMKVDVSQVKPEIGKAISLLKDFQDSQNNVEILASVGLDTKEAKGVSSKLLEQIKSLPSEVQLSLGLDTSSVGFLEKSIENLDVSALAEVGVDESAFTEQVPKTIPVDVHYEQSGVENLPDSFPTITRVVNYVAQGHIPGSAAMSGNHGLNGTAHVGGTAYAGGNWGTAPGGNTLVGELGREIVVDPKTGRWYTVGDNGAEFRDIPKNAIVFNHRQSKNLLENGYVSGRAHALAGGTALVSGRYMPNGKYYKYDPVEGLVEVSGNRKPAVLPRSPSGAPKETEPSDLSEEKKQLEIFDWIELKINKLERAVKKLGDTAKNTFKSLQTRVVASKDSIKKINKEISKQESAYERYLDEADSIDLSDSLKKKVRNGSIEIGEYDEGTQKLIADYQKWYEKAIACKDAVDDLHDSLAEMHKEQFDAIATDYENQMSLYEHIANQYQNAADLLEAKGYLENEDYFTGMQNAEKEKLSILNNELSSLEKQFSVAMSSGEIERYSEAWYEFQNSINGVKEEIAETNVNIAEFDKKIREVQWKRFDYAHEKISNITKEADFLIDLMSRVDLYDDSGKMTENGQAVMGLHGQNYNVYMSQADSYAKEILSLNKKIANDPSNTDLLKRKEELLDLQRESISAAEDEKQAMVDLVQNGIDLELNSLEELIDTYSDALDSAKSLHDYQDKVSDKTDEISVLQKQILAYANDGSDESRSKAQKLSVDLKKAQKDLEDIEYQRYIDDQKKLLDELYSEYEDALNQRLDNVDSLVSDLIGDVNANSDSINSTIENSAKDVGYTITDELKNIWSQSGDVIGMYGDALSYQMTTVQNALGAIFATIDSMVPENAEDGAIDNVTKQRLMNSLLANMSDDPVLIYRSNGLGGFANVRHNVAKPANHGEIAQTTSISQETNITMGDIVIDHVEDYDDFVYKMQHDKKFEEMIQSMTTDRMLGRNSLGKYSTTWK